MPRSRVQRRAISTSMAASTSRATWRREGSYSRTESCGRRPPPASVPGWPRLLDPSARSVVPVLVQDEPRHAPLLPDERDLRVHGFQEELRLRFGKDRKFLLAGGLDEEGVALARHGDGKRRGQRVFADAGLEGFRGDFALLALLRRLRERKA